MPTINASVAGTSTSIIPESMPYCTTSREQGKSTLLGDRCPCRLYQLFHIAESPVVRRGEDDRDDRVRKIRLKDDSEIASREIGISRLTHHKARDRA